MALRVVKAVLTAVLLGFSPPLGKTLAVHEGGENNSSSPSDHHPVTKLRGDAIIRTSHVEESVVIVVFVGNDGRCLLACTSMRSSVRVVFGYAHNA